MKVVVARTREQKIDFVVRRVYAEGYRRSAMGAAFARKLHEDRIARGLKVTWLTAMIAAYWRAFYVRSAI